MEPPNTPEFSAERKHPPVATAFWSAALLCRFELAPKAVEDYRTPKRRRLSFGQWQRQQFSRNDSHGMRRRAQPGIGRHESIAANVASRCPARKSGKHEKTFTGHE